MSFILVVISFMFFNINACHGLPECCFAPIHFPDFQKNVNCMLNCSNSEKEEPDLCPCHNREYDNQMLHSLTKGNFSMPHIVCHELIWTIKKIYGQFVLAWEFKSITDISIAYLIEARNSTTDARWHFVGMTNETIVKIKNLEIQVRYQFRVTPITFNKAFEALLSDWILIPDIETFYSSPRNIKVTNFDFQKNSVCATVEWSASKDRSCSFELFWLPSFGGEYFEQKIVTLLNGNLSTILPGLNFELNYTITISPYEASSIRDVIAAHRWFVTPSCLSITNGNFSLCAPGPPLNVTVLWSPAELKAFLKWQPPRFSSMSNRVSNYYLTIAEISERFGSIIRYKDHILLEKNSTFLTVSDLQPSKLYVFSLKAISSGGTGLPAITELKTKMIRKKNYRLDEVPWHYIVPSVIFLLIILSIYVILRIIRARRKAKSLVYPNGLADVPNHLIPSLVPSNKIELKDVLGQGAFGVVHKGIYIHKKFKEIVAVKTFPAETSTRRKLLNEIDILRLIGRHNHVVSLVGFTLNIDKMYLILEFCALGDLQSYLPRFKKVLIGVKIQRCLNHTLSTDPKYGIQLCKYIYQVAVGMEYISSLKLIHRDIAARNILMYSLDHVKIADFGLSRDVYETQFYHTTKRSRLPIKWMAPEAIEKQRFSSRTDVWSFGVLMWEIFKFGDEPYMGYSNSEILPLLKSGHRLAKPNTCNYEWYDIMLKCWRSNPRRRPLFKELVQKTGSIIAELSNYTRIVPTQYYL